MTAQLTLIDTDGPDWKIPEATREIGRRGLAEARAILRSIPRRSEDEPESAPSPGTNGNGTGHGHRHPAAA